MRGTVAKQETFEWTEAFKVANEIRSKLEPHCENIMIVGSLRRQCETVHDIDIVLVPLPGHLQLLLEFQGIMGHDWRNLKMGAKLVHGTYSGIPVDLYFATLDTWWTLVVIRTGSAGHNIRLCSRAKAMGMKLHADGSGIEHIETGKRLIPTTEQQIFDLLQLDYVEPKDRG